MFIANLRRDYNLTSLRRSDLDADPLKQFEKWFAQAAGLRPSGRVRKFLIQLYKRVFLGGGSLGMEVNAATLATANAAGEPSARTVLLKGMDARGFIFFTNYDSRKARELAENPHAAMVFYWTDQARQVCLSGPVTKLPRSESEAYFKSRPRGSRLGAWASRQSEPVENRAVLEKCWNELEAKYPDAAIPTPPNWGGYVIAPTRIEFWQGRPSRLHDRFSYSLQPDQSWRLERLCP